MKVGPTLFLQIPLNVGILEGTISAFCCRRLLLSILPVRPSLALSNLQEDCLSGLLMCAWQRLAGLLIKSMIVAQAYAHTHTNRHTLSILHSHTHCPPIGPAGSDSSSLWVKWVGWSAWVAWQSLFCYFKWQRVVKVSSFSHELLL
jgi:hypothetical protein